MKRSFVNRAVVSGLVVGLIAGTPATTIYAADDAATQQESVADQADTTLAEVAEKQDDVSGDEEETTEDTETPVEEVLTEDGSKDADPDGNEDLNESNSEEAATEEDTTDVNQEDEVPGSDTEGQSADKTEEAISLAQRFAPRQLVEESDRNEVPTSLSITGPETVSYVGDSINFTATLKDSSGKGLANKTVYLRVYQPGVRGSEKSFYGLTDSDGNVVIPASGLDAGTYSVYAEVYRDPGQISSGQKGTYSAAESNTVKDVTVNPPEQRPGEATDTPSDTSEEVKEQTPTSVSLSLERETSTSDNFNVKVSATDQNGNPVIENIQGKDNIEIYVDGKLVRSGNLENDEYLGDVGKKTFYYVNVGSIGEHEVQVKYIGRGEYASSQSQYYHLSVQKDSYTAAPIDLSQRSDDNKPGSGEDPNSGNVQENGDDQQTGDNEAGKATTVSIYQLDKDSGTRWFNFYIDAKDENQEPVTEYISANPNNIELFINNQKVEEGSLEYIGGNEERGKIKLYTQLAPGQEYEIYVKYVGRGNYASSESQHFILKVPENGDDFKYEVKPSEPSKPDDPETTETSDKPVTTDPETSVDGSEQPSTPEEPNTEPAGSEQPSIPEEPNTEPTGSEQPSTPEEPNASTVVTAPDNLTATTPEVVIIPSIEEYLPSANDSDNVSWVITSQPSSSSTTTDAPSASTDTEFDDVPVDDSTDLKAAVSYIVKKGLTQAVAPNKFNPTGQITRGEFLIYLYRLAGAASGKATTQFKDIADIRDSELLAAINWAIANHIISGYGDGTFRPNAPVSNAEAIALLHRLKTGGDTEKSQQGAWYSKNVTWAIDNGIISDAKSIGSVTTRGQAAQFIYRASK